MITHMTESNSDMFPEEDICNKVMNVLMTFINDEENMSEGYKIYRVNK